MRESAAWSLVVRVGREGRGSAWPEGGVGGPCSPTGAVRIGAWGGGACTCAHTEPTTPEPTMAPSSGRRAEEPEGPFLLRS